MLWLPLRLFQFNKDPDKSGPGVIALINVAQATTIWRQTDGRHSWTCIGYPAYASDGSSIPEQLTDAVCETPKEIEELIKMKTALDTSKEMLRVPSIICDVCSKEIRESAAGDHRE